MAQQVPPFILVPAEGARSVRAVYDESWERLLEDALYRSGDNAFTADWGGSLFTMDANNADWKANGRYLCNPTMKSLTIDKFGTNLQGARLGNFHHFIKGLAANRSIERLHISRCTFDNVFTTTVLRSLAPFLRNNTSLHCLEITSSTIGCSDMCEIQEALKSRKVDSLTSVRIVNSTCPALGKQQLLEAMGGARSLTKLCLMGFPVEWGATRALVKLLEHRESSIRELDIESCSLGDTNFAMLLRSLDVNNKRASSPLTILRIGNNGSRSLSGCKSLARYLKQSQCSLVALEMGNNNLDDECLSHLASALNKNTSLKYVGLGRMQSASTNGWRPFRWNSTVIRHLDLRFNHLDSHGLASDLAGNRTVTKLWLGGISLRRKTKELQAFAAYLSSPGCALQELHLDNTSMNSDDAVILKTGLARNASVQVLDLSDNVSMRRKEWRKEYVNLLCDTSSIESTYKSNHTLQSLGPRTPLSPQLLELLMLNKGCTRAEAARRKILHTHFLRGSGVGIQTFVKMDLNVLPHAIAWLAKGIDGLCSPLYLLLASQPSLFGTYSSSVCRKRKRGSNDHAKPLR